MNVVRNDSSNRNNFVWLRGRGRGGARFQVLWVVPGFLARHLPPLLSVSVRRNTSLITPAQPRSSSSSANPHTTICTGSANCPTTSCSASARHPTIHGSGSTNHPTTAGPDSTIINRPTTSSSASARHPTANGSGRATRCLFGSSSANCRTISSSVSANPRIPYGSGNTNTGTSAARRRALLQRSITSNSSGPKGRTTSSDMRTPKSVSSYMSNDPHCVVAMCEGRGHARGEVGLAAIDTRHPHLILCQISDSQSYINTLTKINVFNPVELILPNTFCEGSQPTKLYTLLRDTYTSISLTTVHRRHFNETIGLQQIKHVCEQEYASVEVLVTSKFYALSAAAALLKYSEFIENKIFAPKSLKVEYQGSHNTTIIDVATASRLELVRSLQGSGSQKSLLGILNHCSTAGGTRLLRANILQPPCLPEIIRNRLDSVQEMVDHPEMFAALQLMLSKFTNVEQLLCLCMHIPQQDNTRVAEFQLKYILLLKNILELLPGLNTVLKDAHSNCLRSAREALSDSRFAKILERILQTLNNDARHEKNFTASHMQRNFAVKTNINGLLDVARKTYCEIIEDIVALVSQLAEETNLPLEVGFTTARGFHIQLSLGNKRAFHDLNLPDKFIQVQRSRNNYTFTTQELVILDQRGKEILQEVQSISSVVIFGLLTDIRGQIGCLYKLTENILQLDMLVSFAHVSSINNYTRPQFSTELDVKQARHPILDFISHTTPKSNDAFASSSYNFHIITGPNMSGKSIYMRQIAMLQIMAQIGCYVPAESAKFRITDHIFSRIGFDDNIESNASTFVLEVREMHYIKQALTPTSLVIMDELCRGTSVEDGTALTWALCEELLHTTAFFFLATHFLFVTKLQDLYYNVINHHFEVKEEETEKGRGRLVYTHCLKPGVTQVAHYGLRLAENLAMPASIVESARTVVEEILQHRKPEPRIDDNGVNEQYVYELCTQLLSATEVEGGLTVEMCRQIKERFQQNNAIASEQNGAISKPENRETSLNLLEPITIMHVDQSVTVELTDMEEDLVEENRDIDRILEEQEVREEEIIMKHRSLDGSPTKQTKNITLHASI